MMTKIENKVEKIEKEVVVMKEILFDIVNKFDEDTNTIITKLNELKEMHTQKMLEVLEIANSLKDKVQKVKGGIDKFQSEVLTFKQ